MKFKELSTGQRHADPQQVLAHWSEMPYILRLHIINSASNGFDVAWLDEWFEAWRDGKAASVVLNVIPTRTMMQNATGAPEILVHAAMRDEAAKLGQDALAKINFRRRLDIFCDHTLQGRVSGCKIAAAQNLQQELDLNTATFELLRWIANIDPQVRLFAPENGIIHEINLEYVAQFVAEIDGLIQPEFVCGSDSHTDHGAAMGTVHAGQGGPLVLQGAYGIAQPTGIKKIVRINLVGQPGEYFSSKGMALLAGREITTMLNNVPKGKTLYKGAWFDVAGEALPNLLLEDTVPLVNMATDFVSGSRMVVPTQEGTIEFAERSGRDGALTAELNRSAGLWYNPDDDAAIHYDATVTVSAADAEDLMAGPIHPTEVFHASEIHSRGAQGVTKILVYAGVGSCTNGSPLEALQFGLMCKAANERGWKIDPRIKTPFSPGSSLVTLLLERTGLMVHIEAMGYFVIGKSCAGCFTGMSEETAEALLFYLELLKLLKGLNNKVVKVGVSTFNRNWPGRLDKNVPEHYLCDSSQVLAFALHGGLFDMTTVPVRDGVMFKELVAKRADVLALLHEYLTPELYAEAFADIEDGNPMFNQQVPNQSGELFDWKPSFGLDKPTLFDSIDLGAPPATTVKSIYGAKVLADFANVVTTDHLMTANDVKDIPDAWAYLEENFAGTPGLELLKVGMLRCNYTIMRLAAMCAPTIQNKMASKAGGYTVVFLGNPQETTIPQAAVILNKAGEVISVWAEDSFGDGSSRFQAALGMLLNNVKVVVVKSFANLHRESEVAAGLIPLQITSERPADLVFDGSQTVDYLFPEEVTPGCKVGIVVHDDDDIHLEATFRADTDFELEQILNGGLYPWMFRKLNA